MTASMFPNYPGAGRPREASEIGATWSDVDVMIRALQGKRTGSSAMVRCPAHDDRNPSLHVTLTDGSLLVKCFAGCTQAAVVARMKSLGLWPDSVIRKPFRLAANVGDVDQSDDDLGVVVATYDYCGADGIVLYRVCRFDPKNFRPRVLDGGGWKGRGPKPGDRILYRLPEVLEAPIVFVTEGEKDVETLRDYGFVATTNIGGAKQPWLPQYTEALTGREVILIPDNDSPGRQHMASVARELFGHVARLLVLELDDGKDVTEWFERGHSELELIEAVERPEVVSE